MESERRNYLTMLMQWFAQGSRWSKAYDIITNAQSGPISLRVFEFLTNQYLRNHEVQYMVQDPDGSSRMFDLRATLERTHTAMRKKNSEPFARTNPRERDSCRFLFGFGDKKVMTTVGQLNFMRMVIENCLDQWLSVEENLCHVLAAKREYQSLATAATARHPPRKIQPVQCKRTAARAAV
jgi:hypothetical protein